MDPDELTGRALDAEIARRIFGRDDLPRHVAFYSSNFSASLTLAHELSMRGWVRRGDAREREGPRGTFRVVLERKHNGIAQSVTADGMTVEEAFARAALKAVEP